MKPRRWHWPTVTTPAPGMPPAPLWNRLAWMAAIWAVSITALLLVALVLRLVLKV